MGPTQPATTDSRRPEIGVVHRGPETFSEIFSGGPSRAPSLRRFRDGRSPPSSTSDGVAWSTSAPTTRSRTRPRWNRSQPAGGNPIASHAFDPRRGCQPAHPNQAKAPKIDSPGEGQTLGYRVADVPSKRLPCGGFRDGRSPPSSTSVWVPAQTPRRDDPLEPQPARRRQPDSQPAFGPRRGCQPASGTAAKAPKLDSPGEGQTLGYRVADVPNQGSRASPTSWEVSTSAQPTTGQPASGCAVSRGAQPALQTTDRRTDPAGAAAKPTAATR